MIYQLFIVAPSVFYIVTRSNFNKFLKYIMIFLVLFLNAYFNRIILGRHEKEVSSSLMFLIIDYLPLFSIFLMWLILNVYLSKKTTFIKN